jgi:hypothetical protein
MDDLAKAMAGVASTGGGADLIKRVFAFGGTHSDYFPDPNSFVDTLKGIDWVQLREIAPGQNRIAKVLGEVGATPNHRKHAHMLLHAIHKNQKDGFRIAGVDFDYYVEVAGEVRKRQPDLRVIDPSLPSPHHLDIEIKSWGALMDADATAVQNIFSARMTQFLRRTEQGSVDMTRLIRDGAPVCAMLPPAAVHAIAQPGNLRGAAAFVEASRSIMKTDANWEWYLEHVIGEANLLNVPPNRSRQQLRIAYEAYIDAPNGVVTTRLNEYWRIL